VNEPKPQHFAGSKALGYDASRAPLAPLYGALQLCTDAVLSSLPEESQVLCVGAGTGDELIHLARAHPAWTFAVVEPSSDMTALCREKAGRAGVGVRCTFFEGYVDSVPEAASFDAALCLLVSYFLLDPGERQVLFSAIARRLRHGGLLVNAELAADVSTPEYATLRDAWVAMHRTAGLGMTPDYLGRDVAVNSAVDIEAMLGRAGFSESTLFFQALLISAWRSRVWHGEQGDHQQAHGADGHR
jgi:tRNA (cmo5U34)-methyltransferase